jgi:hypothetical protein
MPFLDIVPVAAETIIGIFKGRFQKKNAFFGMKLPAFAGRARRGRLPDYSIFTNFYD